MSIQTSEQPLCDPIAFHGSHHRHDVPQTGAGIAVEVYWSVGLVHRNSYTCARWWDVVALMAAMERYWIAQRLLAGLNGHGFYLRSSRQWEWDR